MVFNGASGSHDDAVLESLRAEFSNAGAAPERIIDCQQCDLPDAATLQAAGVGLLAVHGGDGTLNAALSAARGWGGAVLPLPGGTANLLCGELFGDRDALSVAKAFAAEKLVRISRNVVEFAGGIALAEVLAGPGAVWSDVREDMRDGQIGDVVAGVVDAATLSLTGPMVAVVEPELGDPAGYAGVRLTPETKGLAIEGYAARDFSDLVLQGVAVIGRNFREGPHDTLGTHEHALCRSLEDAPIPLMVDGERRDAGAEVKFSLAPLGLDLFCLADG